MAFKKGEGGRKQGSKNKKKTDAEKLEKLLKDYTPESIAKAFKKAKKSVGKGKTIIEHLTEKSYSNPTLALALLRKITADKRIKEEAVVPTEGDWANRSPREIVEDMDNLTSSENPENSTEKEK